MTYYTHNAPAPSRTGIALSIIAALIFGAFAGAYATSGPLNFSATPSEELIIPGQDWHGNVRRSDR